MSSLVVGLYNLSLRSRLSSTRGIDLVYFLNRAKRSRVASLPATVQIDTRHRVVFGTERGNHWRYSRILTVTGHHGSDSCMLIVTTWRLNTTRMNSTRFGRG